MGAKIQENMLCTFYLELQLFDFLFVKNLKYNLLLIFGETFYYDLRYHPFLVGGVNC